ncbi:polyhydroxybutyrate depolymerase [Dyadobacter sp. BE34]|uniref:Polyhydroxybutyrate depolymerase n=1 Tax=Dyadobacter fermentans TaxID=94254 RepID=A0ABU1QTJ0_9BACT|nr:MULTISPECIES: PHB depolymerase family esterase [Dyadobacter]MDR6804456.1 polyhydroxybutyrate depolymerase [Dyadobacter fermentans]MDR7042196.1 polyhydroxybutyrate depolymerase [Dyadobacter sp. BE242]MDR7196598.1 polyhydroxybutyrate depolymerase [Dyadobacter sp. BE34]MDR7212856.1 polyhydroxybutyrate depolymerase [Dyadobacter sp. BE31]MDR7262005.1 polyhydroxybutyrate depolymerase [Dyadobacter sp. BE32]
MFKQLFSAFLILVAFSANAQHVLDSLLIDGHYRVYAYNPSVKVKPGASMVFVMHGSGGEPLGFARRGAKLESLSESENVLVVYPGGYKKYWNECRKASTAVANTQNLNEEAFFNALIDLFASKYKINKKQVFATGFSGGGHMAYKLALTMPGKIRAVSAIVANLPTDENMDCTAMNVPLPVMITNGTADQTNPYNGGEVTTPGVTLGKVRSTDQSFQYWAKLDGYSGEPVKSIMPDGDTSNNITVEKYTYQKKGKPEVTLLKVVNGKHEFVTDFDMFEESWKFFKRQIGK